MLLKLGSKGDDVKKIQSKLGLTADGVFGKKTETAVKQWQKNNNLTADGVVGNATWSKMFGLINTSNTKQVDARVIYNPINVHITSKPNRQIKYIAIHFTAGSRSITGTATNIRNVFIKNSASADFIVDDGSMVQVNPDLNNYYCWAVGDKTNYINGGASLAGKANNSNTISIEVCSTLRHGSVNVANHEGWGFTNTVIDNAIELTKILMKKYNIPIENVVRHYDISGKLCPGIIGWNDGYIYNPITLKSTGKKNNSSKWLEFKKRLV